MMAAPAPRVHPPLRFFDKLVLVAALGVASAIFLSIGWLAIAPDDPQGAVSLLTHHAPVSMLIQATLLAAVTAAIATLMVGSKLPDVGVFAAALGLALASLQGDTAAYLLIHLAQGDLGAERVLAGKLALEGLSWCVALLAAAAVSIAVMRWCVAGSDEPDNAATRVRSSDLAISECPGVAGWLGMRGDRKHLANGIKTLLLTTATAICLFFVLVSGSAPHMIRHGQSCFAACAAFYVGTWLSRRHFACRTAFWNLAAIPLACVVGFGGSMLLGEPSRRYGHLANVPVSDFLRALPLTFVAVGTLGVLAAYWSTEPPKPASEVAAEEGRKKKKRAPKRHGK